MAIPQRTDPRVAGGVRRWHTWPVLRQQTVADHQWNVARIVISIWPGAPRQLIFAALFHDIGEIGTGDIPYPVKRENPDFKVTLDAIERSQHLRMCLPWGLPAPTTCAGLDQRILKLADCLDAWEFSLEELQLGNLNARAVADHIFPAIDEIIRELAREGNEESQRCGVRAEEYMERRKRTHGDIVGDR